MTERRLRPAALQRLCSLHEDTRGEEAGQLEEGCHPAEEEGGDSQGGEEGEGQGGEGEDCQGLSGRGGGGLWQRLYTILFLTELN